MILAIADDNVAGGGDSDSLETFEFAVAAAPAAKGFEESAIGAEDLYAVIAGISNDDVALIVHGNTPWELKLALIRAFRTERR